MPKQKLVTLTLDKFIEKYKPVKRKEENSEMFIGISVFETYGDDHDFVLKQHANLIWTVCTEGETDFINSGYHFVNRMYHSICEVPFNEKEDIVIEI